MSKLIEATIYLAYIDIKGQDAHDSHCLRGTPQEVKRDFNILIEQINKNIHK